MKPLLQPNAPREIVLKPPTPNYPIFPITEPAPQPRVRG